MGKYLFKRFLSLIPVIIIISIILFTMVNMINLISGDPVRMIYAELFMDPLVQANPTLERELYESLRAEMGLDQSLFVQYLRWVQRTFSGDLGYSHIKRLPVRDVLKEPLKISILINVISLLLSYVVAIFVGIRSAVKRYSLFDTSWQVSSLVFMSMPTFFIGMGLIFLFPITLGILEFGGMPAIRGNTGFFETIGLYARFLTLPVLTLTIGSLAGTIRYVRNAMIEVLKKDYIKTARSKGLKESVVIYSHGFRNALIPVVTIVSGSIVAVFGGSAIVENVFAIDGIGGTLINALNGRDFAIVLTMNLFYAVLGLLANVIMDVSYALVDPRVKLD